MLDKITVKIFNPLIKFIASQADKHNISSKKIFVLSLIVGGLSIVLIANSWYLTGLSFILANRLFASLAIKVEALGPFANNSESKAVIYNLNSFILYQLLLIAFVISEPSNTFIAMILMLVLSVQLITNLLLKQTNERLEQSTIEYRNKYFEILGSLGSETEKITYLILVCLFPNFFQLITFFFVVICLQSTIIKFLSFNNNSSSI